MADPYTHIFKFELDGEFIRGECEFNTDGKASIKPEEWSQPFSADSLEKFHDFIQYVKSLHDENGGVKKIIIKKKE